MIVWLTLASFVGWFVSSLSGGGSPLILIPVLAIFFSPGAIPPVLTTGMLFGNIQRVWLYWRDIDWLLMWWYLPGAIFGSCLGAFTFTKTELEWLPLLLGLFLIFSAIAYSFESKTPIFTVKAWYFLPGGFIYAFLSGLFGSIGPILNPFYLSYGLVKEEMIATKSAQMVAVHIFKIIVYAAFGAFTPAYVGYGVLLGLAAFPGNWLGKKVLSQMTPQSFRRIVIAFVGISGILLIWENRNFLPL